MSVPLVDGVGIGMLGGIATGGWANNGWVIDGILTVPIATDDMAVAIDAAV